MARFSNLRESGISWQWFCSRRLITLLAIRSGARQPFIGSDIERLVPIVQRCAELGLRGLIGIQQLGNVIQRRIAGLRHRFFRLADHRTQRAQYIHGGGGGSLLLIALQSGRAEAGT